ncbi:MAG: prepilin-type N-terminal cleavage/methylation domain-containing protein [Clostridiales bacterium]|nr:prepilin-type N-terminal cleavage/methylation domain-containing protein [Clostridiales bacterium]
MKNSKKGFTLTEVLIVTAIIVIVSGAAIAGIAVTVANANERGQNFQAQQGENWESAAVLKVKNTKIELDNEQTYEESADTPAPTAGVTSDKEDLDGGDDPDPDPKDPDPDPDPDSDKDSLDDDNDTTPKNNTNAVTVGNLTATNGYVTPSDNCPKGVVGISENGNITLNQGSKNTENITITSDSNGNYKLVIDGSDKPWIFQQGVNGGFPGFSWGKWEYDNLTSEQKDWFKDNYGLELAD